VYDAHRVEKVEAVESFRREAACANRSIGSMA
jgi:hypothetical protein